MFSLIFHFLRAERIKNFGAHFFLHALLAEIFGIYVHNHGEKTCTS